MADELAACRGWRLLWPVLVVVAVSAVGAFFLVKSGHHDSVEALTTGTVVADGPDKFEVLAPPRWQLVTQADVTGGGYRLTAQDPADADHNQMLAVLESQKLIS